jgi:Phytanoyl-CoA dioxygenase (PhyH)
VDIMECGASEHVDPLMRELDEYGLFKHVVELEAYGMTVVPPATLRSAPGFAARLRGAIIRTCEKRNGITIGDPATASPPADLVNRRSWHVLEEDEVFVEAATNPVMLALVRWLLGQSAVFSGQTWIIKGRDSGSFTLHSDSHGIPPGAGQIAHMCNASWLCTDYESADDGPTVFVPGSHKYGRATLPHETDLATSPFKSFPLIAEAGSLAIWNGATWHASVPRTKDGLRVTLVQNYMRSYMRPQHLYDRDTSPQLLQKYPELARLVGKPLYPYENPMGPDYSRVGPFKLTGTDQFA